MRLIGRLSTNGQLHAAIGIVRVIAQALTNCRYIIGQGSQDVQHERLPPLQFGHIGLQSRNVSLEFGNVGLQIRNVAVQLRQPEHHADGRAQDGRHYDNQRGGR